MCVRTFCPGRGEDIYRGPTTRGSLIIYLRRFYNRFDFLNILLWAARRDDWTEPPPPDERKDKSAIYRAPYNPFDPLTAPSLAARITYTYIPYTYDLFALLSANGIFYQRVPRYRFQFPTAGSRALSRER